PRQLASIETTIKLSKAQEQMKVAAKSEWQFPTILDASNRASQLSPLSTTTLFGPRGGPYRLLQNEPEAVEQSLWSYILERLAARENVLITWPGLEFEHIARRLLRRIRRQHMS